jgi:DNA-binding MltR family transcriptional regulator
VIKAASNGKPTSSFAKEDQRDTKVNYLLREFNSNPQDEETYAQLQQEIATTHKYTTAIQNFSQKYRISGIYFGSTNFNCYKSMVNSLLDTCGPINDASMRHFKYIYQYCAMYTNWQNAQISC